ncbi:MAG: RidA family protein [Clostridia bacterium]|nr:RidA family protein [Clostridia bacterium]MBR5284847.1 RidA family protein [Clostridia bacterium]
MKNVICTEKAPGAIGPYSQAIEIDNLIYTSGQLGIDPATGNFAEGVQGQTAQALENVKAILETKGLGLDAIIKTTVFIKDMNDFGKINEVYAKYICGDILPARSCVEVARLPKDGLVEIEVIALKK